MANSQRLQLDNDVFVLELENRSLVYAPLRGLLAEVPVAIGKDLRGARGGAPLSTSAAAVLNQLGLLMKPDELTPGLTVPPDDSFAPHGVIFMVTAACNLRCKYCYADAGDYPVEHFDRDMALDAARFVIDNAAAAGSGEAYINYHGGGEPTLDMEFITHVTVGARAYAQERYRGSVCVVASMVSNGMVSRSKLVWMAENIDSIQISYDGPPSVHDLQRPTVHGGASEGIVAQTIHYLSGRVPDVMLKSTISRASVHRMPEIAEHLCSTFELSRFHFGPVLGTGRGRSGAFGEPSPEDFVSGYYAAQAVADRYGRTIVVSGALKTFPKIRRTFCGITDPNFSLTSDGNISSCYEVMYEEDARASSIFYGHYDEATSAFAVDHAKIAAARQRDVNSIQKCMGCFAKWHCAADCQVRWYNAITGERETGVDVRCEINRVLIRDRLFELLEGTQPTG